MTDQIVASDVRIQGVSLGDMQHREAEGDTEGDTEGDRNATSSPDTGDRQSRRQ
eukprot:COSAG03_NODE_23156_length_282_cov_2.426230_1_plen_53_part_10